MKNKIISLFIFLCICSSVFSQEINKSESSSLFVEESLPVYTEPDLRHFTNAFLEVTLMHICLNFYNRVIDGTEYGQISLDSMWTNLTTPWVWDNDEFYINQLYHPYQGSMYFVAGRSNGLNFWQSLIPTMYGVLTWEYLMETETQSINDLIITNLSGAYVGEILHRSYQLLEDKCLPLAFVISPFDGLTRFTTGQRSPRVSGYVDSFEVFGGYSFVLADKYKSSNPDYNLCNYPNYVYPNVLEYNKSSNVYFGFNYIYGNKYGHSTKEPMDAFDLDFTMLTKPGYFYYSIISQGLILSKALNTDFNSTIGLSYNFDYVMASDLNYNNNSLNLFYGQEHKDSENKNIFKWNVSLGFAVDGCSEFYDLHSLYKRRSDSGFEQRLYDIGFGPNLKFNIDYSNPVFGKIYMNGFVSFFVNPKAILPYEGSTGSNFVSLVELGYEHLVYKNISLGLNELLYYKKGNYDNTDDITHKMAQTNLYVKYSF